MNAEILRIEMPVHLPAGWTVKGRIVVKNTGTSTWVGDGPHPFKLGEYPPGTAKWVTGGRIALPAGVTVPPGGTHAFEATFTAPATYGVHAFAFQMVRENVSWFGPVASMNIATTPDPVWPREIILNTGSYEGTRYPAPSVTRRFHWRNQTNQDLRIKAVYLWTGMEVDGVADVNLVLMRDDTNGIISIQQWDHYHNPAAPNHGCWDKLEEEVVIPNGTGITLYATVVGFAPPGVSIIRPGVHHVCLIAGSLEGGVMAAKAPPENYHDLIFPANLLALERPCSFSLPSSAEVAASSSQSSIPAMLTTVAGWIKALPRAFAWLKKS